MFLDFILPKITKMNEFFQSDKVLITDLHSEMSRAYKELLLYFLSGSYVNSRELHLVDPSNSNHFVNINSLYLGVAVSSALNCKEIIARPDLKEHFLQKCLTFLSILCSEIKKRFEFSNFVLSQLHIFKPKNAISVKLREQHPSLLPLLNKMKRFSDQQDWQAIDDQWRLLPIYVFPEDYNIDTESSIDKFWGKLLAFKCETTENAVFKHLSEFVTNILCLPHSNAACERIFSQVNLIKTKQRNRLITETINGNLLASQHVRSTNGTCYNFQPDKSMFSKMKKESLYNKSTAENVDEYTFDG